MRDIERAIFFEDLAQNWPRLKSMSPMRSKAYWHAVKQYPVEAVTAALIGLIENEETNRAPSPKALRTKVENLMGSRRYAREPEPDALTALAADIEAGRIDRALLHSSGPEWAVETHSVMRDKDEARVRVIALYQQDPPPREGYGRGCYPMPAAEFEEWEWRSTKPTMGAAASPAGNGAHGQVPGPTPASQPPPGPPPPEDDSIASFLGHLPPKKGEKR